MKITIIGASGVRTPQLVKALLYSKITDPREIVLFDINESHLQVIYQVIQALPKPKSTEKDVSIDWTTNKEKALKDADYIFFTIRVGEIYSRIIDEEIPLRYGVVGQETTGPGGFAMALRTIPVMMDYYALIKEVAPKAWLLNLTNPSGLITQALMDAGCERVIGICDSPSSLIKNIKVALKLPSDSLWFDYFGLNHLGWIKGIRYRGQDIFREVLQNDEALKHHGQTLLKPDYIRSLQVIPSEYLLYYYFHQPIVEMLKKKRISRAHLIEDLNKRLFKELEHKERSPVSTLDIYKKYLGARNGSYLKMETDGLEQNEMVRQLWEDQSSTGVHQIEENGYAEIALWVLEGLNGNNPRILILNVKNEGAISFLKGKDVVEIPTFVDENGVHPFVVEGSIPEECQDLLEKVKHYERLVIEAVKERSYAIALKALDAHPLVPNEDVAKSILDDYIGEHGDYFPRFY